MRSYLPPGRRGWHNDLARWLLVPPVVAAMLYASSWLGLLGLRPSTAAVDTRSQLSASYSRWTYAAIPPLQPEIAAAIEHDQTVQTPTQAATAETVPGASGSEAIAVVTAPSSRVIFVTQTPEPAIALLTTRESVLPTDTLPPPTDPPPATGTDTSAPPPTASPSQTLIPSSTATTQVPPSATWTPVPPTPTSTVPPPAPTATDPPLLLAIGGQVREPGNEALGGVTLQLSTGQSVQTDVKGHYRLEGLIAGLYEITPSRPGCRFSPSSRTVGLDSADLFDIDFKGHCRSEEPTATEFRPPLSSETLTPPSETPTPSPTATPYPSNKPEPSHTPKPSPTPQPTHTPRPTNTPRPTHTPTPTCTPKPDLVTGLDDECEDD